MKIDSSIFQDLVKFYGEAFHLPPLSAKIYAYLIFDFERKGICFDQFVEIFHASKSSVSSNLQHLLTSNLIKDFTPIDSRKRYFVINPNYIKIRFQEIMQKMANEIEILDKLHQFRNSDDENYNEKFEIYKSLLHKNIDNIQETLTKL
ncbi:GbsR/MarR family transcriptional regulator [Chryseobacterium koreense]|uniref:GbsR/MarR family transcriptional regulator n=1 Tax=Chryseobacterium koreense TaxID=232216 RepID=UPI0026F07852|nr:transcriptional regulator [Chryseobacterium koreense]